MPPSVFIRRSVLVLLLLLLSLPAGAHARSTGLPSLVAIQGAVPPLVQDGLAPWLSPLLPTRQLSLAVALASRDQAGLDRMLRAVYTPGSPLYHHYLTPAAFAVRFGPDPAAVHALTVWLQAQGLRAGSWHGGFILPVTGDVAHITAALHIGIRQYRFPDGTRFAPESDPLLPTALAPAVRTIMGLSQIEAPRSAAHAGIPPRHRTIQSPVLVGASHVSQRPLTGPGGGYTPKEVTSAYDFTPIYRAGYHGEHMRVALVELAPYLAGDIAAYAAQYGITPPAINNITIPPGNAGETQIEATLDIEQLLAGAPGAAIDVYNAPNDATGIGQVEAYSQVARAGNVDVLSLGWVKCEPGAADVAGFIDTQHAIFQQLAVQGTTVVSATGDDGAYACGDQAQQYATQPAVDLPASDPYVLAVGASDLALTTHNGAAAIGSEIAWSCRPHPKNNCAANGPMGAGSGGGLSVIFHQGDQYHTDLSWQTGPGVSNSFSTGGRQVPDVVLSGSYGTTLDHEYSMYYKGSWLLGAGTSAATPLWAALILLTDQYLEAKGLPRLGWVNPLLYQLGATVQIYPAFHDITSGNNLLYSAGPGWDYASGWGSPDAWNFLRDAVALVRATKLPVIPTTTTSPTPTTSVTMGTATPIFAATSTPSPTAMAFPSASTSATSSPNTTPLPTATATLGFPSPTPGPGRRQPSHTPTPKPTPLCAGSGIANGTFQTGSLVCWHASGTPLPRVGPSTHFEHRFSVQLGNPKPGAAGIALSQTFTVPSGLVHPRLHIGFWLARSVSGASPIWHADPTCAKKCPRPVSPAPPLVVVRDPHGHVILRTSFLPHRDRAWSGFAVALPVHAGRLTLSIQVPPQPPGASELLSIDDVHVGT